MFYAEENQHIKLMTGAFYEKASPIQKNYSFILKTIFFRDIVNMIVCSIVKLTILLCLNPVTIPYSVFGDIYLSLNNWDH